MPKTISYTHANNQHPPPPIEIVVENGEIQYFTINETAIKTYLHGEIVKLFLAAGIETSSVPVRGVSFRCAPAEF